MKKNKLFLGMAMLAVLCGIAVTSCSKDDDDDELTGGGGGNDNKETVVFTGSASDVTFHSAVLTCSVKEEEVFGLEYEVGIVYDTTTVSLVCGQADSRTGSEIEPSVYRVQLSSLVPATRYYYRSFIRINGKNYYGSIKSFITEKWNVDSEVSGGHGYVDLGLPSGVKWAVCNIGAESPEEYGDYYAWGETELKDTYTEGNSKWYGFSFRSLQNQGVIDGDGNLTAAYDVAAVEWGGKWRMPTLRELQELMNECTWEWVWSSTVKGYAVSGPNGKAIFLPAAGYRYDSDLRNAGSCGHCWSSSASDDYYDAYRLYFYSGSLDWYYRNRYYGFSVRPVSE